MATKIVPTMKPACAVGYILARLAGIAVRLTKAYVAVVSGHAARVYSRACLKTRIRGCVASVSWMGAFAIAILSATRFRVCTAFLHGRRLR